MVKCAEPCLWACAAILLLISCVSLYTDLCNERVIVHVNPDPRTRYESELRWEDPYTGRMFLKRHLGIPGSFHEKKIADARGGASLDTAKEYYGPGQHGPFDSIVLRGCIDVMHRTDVHLDWFHNEFIISPGVCLVMRTVALSALFCLTVFRCIVFLFARKFFFPRVKTNQGQGGREPRRSWRILSKGPVLCPPSSSSPVDGIDFDLSSYKGPLTRSMAKRLSSQVK